MLTQIHGLNIYFTAEGRGDPVILLHGWGTSSQSLRGIQEALAGDYTALAVDLPGFGWSQPPPSAWGVAEYSGVIARLMEAQGIQRAAILGHSFGGRVGIRLAAEQPDKVSRLVLVASAGIRPKRGVGYYARVGTAKIVKQILRLPGWGRIGHRLASRLSDRIGSRDYRAAGHMRSTLVKVVNEDLTPVLPSIHAPTLILWGDQDQEVPRSAIETITCGIRQARLVVFRGAGHFPFLDAPDEFHRTLDGFLHEGGRW